MPTPRIKRTTTGSTFIQETNLASLSIIRHSVVIAEYCNVYSYLDNPFVLSVPQESHSQFLSDQYNITTLVKLWYSEATPLLVWPTLPTSVVWSSKHHSIHSNFYRISLMLCVQLLDSNAHNKSSDESPTWYSQVFAFVYHLLMLFSVQMRDRNALILTKKK